MTDTVADLIKSWRDTDDFVKAETKRFGEHMKPYRERLEAIEREVHKFLIDTGTEKVSKKGLGTAYISEVMNLKVDNPETTLDFALDNYDTIGADYIKVSPKIESVRAYMAEHDGQLPPGLSATYFRHVNIRRT